MKNLKMFKTTITAAFIVIAISLIYVPNAQALTAGPNNPGSVVNNTGIGSVAWSNPSNALTQNSSYAYVQLSQNTYSNYLNSSNYGFSIPSDATINGIEVTIYGYMQYISGSGGYDTWFQLRKSGALAGTYKTPYIAFNPGSVVTAGGSSDLWGTTWTPADINNSNFGISAWFRLDSQTQTLAEYIDAIRITVHYTPAAPTATPTPSTTIPILAGTPSQSGMTDTVITLGGNVTSDGGAALSAKGICYSLTSQDSTPGFTTAGGSSPETNVTCVNHGNTSTGTFTVSQITGLTPNSAYSFRAFARNSVGNGYSNVGSFTTYDDPAVTTSAASSIGGTSATLNSVVDPNGGLTNVYYLWGSQSGVACSSQPNTLDGPAGLTGTSNISPNATVLSDGLSASTTYYFCVMATNAYGTTYGSVENFTTGAGNPTSYTFMVAGDALGSGATDCYDDSGAPCPPSTPSTGTSTSTAINGITWSASTGPAPTSYTFYWCTGSECSNFSNSTSASSGHNLSGSCGNTYRYRIVATNASGSSTPSGIQTANTGSCVSIPTLASTPSSSSITQNSATLGGDVTSNGGETLSAKGVCYALTSQDSTPGFTTAGGSTPETNVTCVNHGNTSTGSFTVSASSLTANSAYSFRAFARNSAGNGYSNVGSFTTLSLLANGQNCSSGSQCSSGNCYIDNDNDRYAPSSGTSTCRASSQLGGTDCYDSNSNARPGQTSWFSSHRGDSSFDYNCASGTELEYGTTMTNYPYSCTTNCTTSQNTPGWTGAVNPAPNTSNCGQSFRRSSGCSRYSDTSCNISIGTGAANCSGAGSCFSTDSTITVRCR